MGGWVHTLGLGNKGALRGSIRGGVSLGSHSRYGPFNSLVKPRLDLGVGRRAGVRRLAIYSYGYRAAIHDQTHRKCPVCPRQTNLNVLGHIGRT